MEQNAQEYVAFMEGVCDKLGCKEVLPSLKEGFSLYLEASKEGYKAYLESDEDKFPWMHQFDSITRVPCNKTDLMKSSQYYIVSKDNKFNVFRAAIGGLSGPATTGYCISDVWFDEITVDRVLPYKAPTFNVTIGGVKLKMNDVGILFGQHGEPIGKCHSEAELIDKLSGTNTKLVEPVNAVQPKQEAISQYEQPTPGNIDRIIRDTNTSKVDFVQNIDNIQDAGVRDTIKATDVYKDASRPTYRRKVLKDIEKNPNDYSHFEPEGAPDSDYFANRDGYKSRSEFSKKPDAFHKLSPEVRSHLRHWVSQDGVSPSSIARVLELFPNLTGQDFDNINELAGPRGQYYIEKAAQCYKDHPELKQLMTDMNDRRLDCLWSGNYSGDDPEYRRLTNEIRQIAAEYGVWGTDESGERTAAADADGE